MIFQPDPILFPTPGAVAEQFVEAARDGTMWPAFVDSMSALGLGLLLALVTGVPLGLMIGMSPTTDLLTSPYLWGFFAMPRIALAPLMILWLGFGMEVKVWLVYLSAVIPLILSCKDGVQTVDGSLVQAARSFGAGRVDLFAKVIAPSTLPFIASGIRNGISRGFVGLLVIELTVGSGGIGTEVMRVDARLQHRPHVRVREPARRGRAGADLAVETAGTGRQQVARGGVVVSASSDTRLAERLATGTPDAPRRRRPRGRRVYSRKQRWIIGVLNLATFFLVWQLAATLSDIPQLFLPSVTDVFRELQEMSAEGILWGNLWISAWIYIVGMAISLVIAIPMGLTVGGIRILDKILSPYIWAIYTTPRLILMPLILLWVGINDTARIVIIVCRPCPPRWSW